MDRTKSIVTIYLDERQRANVHEATCYKLQHLNERGDMTAHKTNNLGDNYPSRTENEVWDLWHMAISGECAGYDYIGAVFKPERYKTYVKGEPDVAGLFDVKSAPPTNVGGRPSNMIVRCYEIELNPTLPHVLAYVSNCAGQPNARVQLMGWCRNDEIVERAHFTTKPHVRTSFPSRPTVAYYVAHTALHPMNTFPY